MFLNEKKKAYSVRYSRYSKTQLKIWARDQGGLHSPPSQLIFEEETTFGTGLNVQTILFNKEGEVSLI